jgi:phage-related minor tail protein
MADNKSRELMIKIDVDISDALTGLKAIQREAKKATQALRELETFQQPTINITINGASEDVAHQLINELRKRGVRI